MSKQKAGQMPIQTDTTVVQDPPTEKPGEGSGWDGMPVVASEDDAEYGYKPEGSGKPSPPRYDYVDDHDVPEDQGEKGPKPKEGDAPKPLSRSDWADYGLTEEEATDLDGKGELGRALDLIDRRFAKLGAEPPKEGEQANPPMKQTAGPLELKLDTDVYDDGLVAQVGGIVEHVNSLHQKLEGILGASRRQQMDAFFASLGEEYQEVFGKGPLDALPSRSVMRERRLEVERTVDILRAGYERVGQPVPGENVLQERAARMIAGNEMQAAARKRAAQQARDTQGQFVAKPTHREGKPHTGRERAVQFVEDFYRRKGM